MISKSRLEAALRPAGWALAAASAVFLIVVAHSHWEAITALSIAPRQWLILSGLAVLYGASLLLLAAAWHHVLVLSQARPRGPVHSVWAHASAQLAKYVPGNVFHLLGRHMIHRAAGMDDKPLALAAVLEVALMLMAAVSIVALCVYSGAPAVLQPFRMVLAAGIGAGVLVLLYIVQRLAGGPLAALLTAFSAYLLFFALMGAIIVVLATMLGAGASWAIAGGGVSAWIAGFVTPGAPGGLGVREAAMVLFDAGQAGSQVLIVTALLFRAVTFAGDLVCFALGNLLFRIASKRASLLATG